MRKIGRESAYGEERKGEKEIGKGERDREQKREKL